jgi:hypothetical protein
MSTSVWPADYFKEPHEMDRKHANHLVVLLISPFEPRAKYNEVLAFCRSVCSEIGQMIGAEVECIRADSLSTPNVIHRDIWNYIQMSEAVIADVSDKNGNVMIELGVAASYRDKRNVIVIQDLNTEGSFLFDISPARHLIYPGKLSDAPEFRNKLKNALLFALTPAPYVPQDMPALELPLHLQLTRPKSCRHLLSPSNSHRRLLSDGLEFGSFYVYRYSWLTIGQEHFSDVRVRARMRFTALKPDIDIGEGWIGIMLRSQHFFAEGGHLLYVLSDGTVRLTQPINEFNKEQIDPCLGQIQEFKLHDWIYFDILFDEHALSGSVGDVDFNIHVTDMPFNYNAGLIRFQTYLSRACINNLQVEIPG